MNTRKRVLAAFCLLWLAGCAPANVYMRDRAYDLADVFRANAGVGPGLGAVVFVTQYVRAGAILSVAERLGMVGREAGLWREARLECETVAAAFAAMRRDPQRPSTVHWVAAEASRWEVNPLLTGKLRWGSTPELSGPLEVGFRAHLLLLGAEVGLRPDEAADFLTGFFGLDLNKDDSWTRIVDLRERVAAPRDGRTARDQFYCYREMLDLGPGKEIMDECIAELLQIGAQAQKSGAFDLAMSCYEAILASGPSQTAREGVARITSDPHMHLRFLLQRGERMSVNVHAVVTSESLEQQGRGRSMLEEVIRLAPESPEAQEAREMLKTGRPSRRSEVSPP